MAKAKYEAWLQPENLTLVQGWRRDGLSDAQVAHNMGIARGTLHKWLGEYKALSDAYKKGSEVSTYEVENALYKSALGMEVTETELTEVKDMNGETVQKVLKQRKRYIPPNLGSIIFILKNRKSDKWRDKREIELPEAPDDGFMKALTVSAENDWSTDEETGTDGVSV